MQHQSYGAKSKHGSGELRGQCLELAAVAGPSVSIIRALDQLGEEVQARVWAGEVASLEADILSKMLREALPSDIVVERFARVLYVEYLAGNKAALRRYEQGLRVFWQEALRTHTVLALGLSGTAQNLLVCAILLDRRDLASEASSHLPEGPWRELAQAWAEGNNLLLGQLEQQLAANIEAEESSGSLSVLSDNWSYLLLNRLRRRREEDMATGGAANNGR